MNLKEWQFWTLTGVGGVTLLLVVVNIIMFNGNRGIQNEINGRQQFINESMQLERLNREIVNALANLAARNDDEDIKQLLGAHGITFTVNRNAGSAEAGQKKKDGR
jgi:hypothetical protein